MSATLLCERVRARFAAAPLAKAIGIPGAMALFFVGYFATLRHPLHPALLMPAGPVDRWIGFQPWTVPLYCSLWAYVALPACLAPSRFQLFRLAAAATLLALAGLIVFLVWPTTVASVGTGFLKQVDRGGNACPSLHAAFTVFSAVRLARIRAELGAGRMWRALNLLWAAAILFATLATKQHVLTDLLAGAVLGAAAAQFFSSSRSNEPSSPSCASSAARR